MANKATFDALEKRGIADEARSAGWESLTLRNGRAGWSYPVYNARGDAYREKRWKSADGENPKYLWLPSKPDKAKYYFLPGTMSDIQAHNGLCYLAGGEPDVLAYRSAGIRNVICWLDGEGSPPSTLANDLSHMGVTLLIYVPDRDLAGMQSAQKVSDLLDGTGIELMLYQLPGEVGSKQDVNDLWLEVDGDAKAFEARLLSLDALDAVDMYLYAKQTGPAKHKATENVRDNLDRWRGEWHKSIIDAMGNPDATEGNTKRWRCPLPGHEDRHPSFTFTDRQTPGFLWPQCTCGIQDRKDAWDVLASALNVDSWNDFKAFQAARDGYVSPSAPSHKQQTLTNAPANSDQLPHSGTLWVDMHDVYAKLRAELVGDIQTDVKPVINPLSVLHQFGGFAKFMRRGKVTVITGVSGGGKTLLLMTMIVKLLQEGHDVIWWGPEWSPEEYAEQNLQRFDGISMDQLDNWRIWQEYERAGIAKEMSARWGLSRPGDSVIKRSVQVLDDIMSWPGRMYVIPSFDLSLSEVTDVMKGLVRIKRAEGRNVVAFAFDYVQLAQKRGARDWTWAEQVVGEVKAACGVADLCGFVSSQVRKSDSEKVRDGMQLTQGSAQGLSDAQANLYITLTPDVDEDGQFKNTAWLNVVKNSRGRKGKVQVYTDYAHLAVLDKKVTTIDEDIDAALAQQPVNFGGGFGA